MYNIDGKSRALFTVCNPWIKPFIANVARRGRCVFLHFARCFDLPRDSRTPPFPAVVRLDRTWPCARNHSLDPLILLPLLLRWWLSFRYPGFDLVVRRSDVLDEVSPPKYVDVIQMAIVQFLLGQALGWLLSGIHFSDGPLAGARAFIQLFMTACVQAVVLVKFPYYRSFRIEIVPRRPVVSATEPLVP
jgi:hypothetical protein